MREAHCYEGYFYFKNKVARSVPNPRGPDGFIEAATTLRVFCQKGEESMGKKSKKYPGVYIVEGKQGVSYGIDYIHPQTGQRVRKILKGVTSVEKASELRAIELADASRGLINTAYGIKAKANPVSFEAMVKVYLKWYKDNPDKKAWETATCNSKPVLRAFKGKLLSDINPWMVEKYKNARAKVRARSTVNS